MRRSPAAPGLIVIALLLLPLPAMAQGQSSDCGFYTYGRAGTAEGRQCGNTGQAPPPQRVTALCRDGTFSFDQGRACWSHGGVVVWRQ